MCESAYGGSRYFNITFTTSQLPNDDGFTAGKQMVSQLPSMISIECGGVTYVALEGLLPQLEGRDKRKSSLLLRFWCVYTPTRFDANSNLR